jgi:phosphohistidine phosphatase
MAPQLWMLRHGEAVPHNSKPDAERELTPRGRRQADAAGAALAALGEEFAACYTSPNVRARETAELACTHLNIEPILEDSLADGFSRVDALALLDSHDGDAHVLIVGHEPTFSQVVYDFTGGRVDFKKGGVAALRASRTSGELLVLTRPRELEALAQALAAKGVRPV